MQQVNIANIPYNLLTSSSNSFAYQALEWRTAGRPTFQALTRHGFTGHEMLDWPPMVHKGGRVYDPQTGRFLSADPHIQEAANSQSYNRYSYTLNNPLSYTDPSGFFFKKLFKGIGKLFSGIAKAIGSLVRLIGRNLRAIAAIGVLFVPGVNIYAAGCVSGMIASGGDLKAGLVGALTAGAFDWVGGIENLTLVAKAAAHGVVGGLSSLALGGSFISGFAAGSVAQVVGGGKAVQSLGKAGQAITRIMAGGLAAMAGGGKFANGAITAAAAYAFNHLATHAAEQQQVQEESGTWDPITDKRIDGLHPDIQDNATNFINEAESRLGIQLRVTDATRTVAEQDALYAQGRTTPGKIRTPLKGGESYHNYGLAIDVVEMRNGVPVYKNPNWPAIGAIGVRNGFEWGGNWKPPDIPHFQMPLGLSIRELQRGVRP